MRRLISIILSLFLYTMIQAQPLDTCITNTIYYEINTSNIIEDSNYDKFINEQLPFALDHLDYLKVVHITGTASLDGPYKKNRDLAFSRAKKIQELLHVDDSTVNVTVEELEELYKLINESNEPYKNQVIKVLSTSNNIERDLKKLKCWDDLKKNYLPKLRYAKIEMHFCNPSEKIIYQTDTIFIQKPVYFRDTIILWRDYTIKPILAIKTNVLSDILITPNIQAELYTWLWGLSLEFDYTCPWWHKDYDSYFYYQLLNGTIGIRKYLNNEYTGHWIGVYGNTAIYDICPWDKDLGWQGELYGLGLGYGYIFQSKKYPRLKFEPYVRVGWFNTKFDKYHASQPWNEKYYYNWYLRASDFIPRRFNMNYFGPTEIGFNITFDLICLRKY